MDTRQRTHNRFGLRLRAPSKNVALQGGDDIFEHEHSTVGLVVSRAAEALRNAAAQTFTEVAAKEQLTLNLR